MIYVNNQDLDIGKIADSGQCFRITRCSEDEYLVCSKNKELAVSAGNKRSVLHCSKAEFSSYWKNYFDLERDYSQFEANIPKKDYFLKEAVEFGRGIRVLRQDPWEALVSFIISQRKNIPAITSCVNKLCEQFGDNGAFPSPEKLAQVSESELASCSLGYRTAYIQDASRAFATGELNMQELSKLDDASLFEQLLRIKGVGKKVALCAMLYGFNRLESFPIDVWMERVLTEHYERGFPHERYHGYSGVLQLWLFYYMRRLGDADN